MNCNDFRAAVLAGEVTGDHEDHAATCASCRAERGSLERAVALLSDPLLWQEPDTGVEDLVVGAVAGAAGAAPTAEAARPRRFILAAAAAALVLVVGAVAAITAGSAGNEPDWEVDIFAVAAPAGDGSVRGWNEAAGTRVAFDVDLDVAPEGFVYELWFSARDVHISGGTFRDLRDVELWLGVARADYPRIWVTLEPLDADPAPSGNTVLDTRR